MVEPIVIDALMLVAFLAVLVKSASFAVDHIIRFSRIIGISELVAGFLVVAIATSTPEITVAIFSVTSGNVGITLGDIFGSNVTNIGLIAALLMLASPIKQIERITAKNLSPFLVIAAAVPLLLLIAGEGSRIIGILLLGIFCAFIYKSFRSSRDRQAESSTGPIDIPAGTKQLGLFFLGIAFVILSAKIVVDTASSIADRTGIRESVIGATIIALGTSLPELSVDLAAVRKRHFDLALGDIVGSSLANIGLILGIVLLLSDIPISFGVLSTLIGFAVVTHVVMFLILRQSRVKVWHSVILLAIYGAFLLAMYGVQITIGSLRFS